MDLTLWMQEDGTGIFGALLFATDIFDAGTIQRMVSNFVVRAHTALGCLCASSAQVILQSKSLAAAQALLGSIVAAPDTPIERLNIVSAEERASLLGAFNPTDLEPPALLHAGQTIPGLLEHWAEATPDKAAVDFEVGWRSYCDFGTPTETCSCHLHSSARRSFEQQSAPSREECPAALSDSCNAQGASLSYAELDRRANQLAHCLVALGVGPEVPVGVMIPRSLEMVVALLGVMKAGGAYVPLDPNYPPDRLALMLEDSEVGLCATVVCCAALFTGKEYLQRKCISMTIRCPQESYFATLLLHTMTTMGGLGCRRRCC